MVLRNPDVEYNVAAFSELSFAVRWQGGLSRGYRPYGIHHVTKRKMNSGRKFGYYAAILSGKEERDIWRLSIAKHFGSLLRQ